MGTTAMVANSTIRLSPAGTPSTSGRLGDLPRRARHRRVGGAEVQALGPLDDPGHPHRRGAGRAARGLRQHRRRQLISPLINPIPGADFSQIHDLPYVFLLLVGVALVRKPGCVTAMVFVNFLLSQLLFGSGHGALDWTDGLTQAIFCDLYIVAAGVRRSGRPRAGCPWSSTGS